MSFLGCLSTFLPSAATGPVNGSAHHRRSAPRPPDGVRLYRVWLRSGIDVLGTRHPQPEEARPIPGCASDGARDGRKTGVGRLSPEEAVGHHGDRMPFALVLPDEDGAGLEASV